MKKKILIVYPHLPHYRFGVFRELQASNLHEYHFASADSERTGTIPVLGAAEIRQFRELKNVWLGRFLWQKGLLRLLRSGEYDGVIFLGDFAHLSTWAGLIICRLAGLNSFLWTIGWHRIESGGVRVLRNTFYGLAKGLMMYGDAGVRIGKRNSFKFDKVAVVGNSYESNLQDSTTRSEVEISKFIDSLPSDSRPKVGAVIRLNPAKRLELLLDAVALLNKQGYGFDVLIVGEGEARLTLERRAKELSVKIYLPGAAYADAEISAAYAQISVTAIPVGAGLSAIQSLAHRRPVVTTDNECRQMPESECIRNGVTGFLYRDGSVESLAQNIIKAHLLRTNDESEFNLSAERELALRWTPAAHASAIEKAYIGFAE